MSRAAALLAVSLLIPACNFTFSTDDSFGNRRYLGRSFAYAKDHFGESLADGTVSIDPGEAEILERKMA